MLIKMSNKDKVTRCMKMSESNRVSHLKTKVVWQCYIVRVKGSISTIVINKTNKDKVNKMDMINKTRINTVMTTIDFNLEK